MAVSLRFELAEKLFLKDPQGSKYGERLLSNAIELIDDLGFERFTFKKLAIKMESSEVSIYRYFENKHLLLTYLNCWYWEWVSYLVDIKTMNVMDSSDKLRRTIHCMIHAHEESNLTDYINEYRLFQIIMKESSKTYHISAIDEENIHGFFLPYKGLVARIATIIQEINPKFPYGKSLGSTIFEMINNQLYYSQHLPRLTSLSQEHSIQELEQMVNHFAFATILFNSDNLLATEHSES